MAASLFVLAILAALRRIRRIQRHSGGCAKPSPARKTIGRTRSNLVGGGHVIKNTASPSTKFTIQKKAIGAGSFGTVRRVISKATGEAMAMKSIPKAGIQDHAAFQQEVDMMMAMDHAHIVRLHETFEDFEGIYLVAELCEGGEMFDAIVEIGNFTEVCCATLMSQMMHAIRYMHVRQIAHRDLKPENFLLKFPKRVPIMDNTLKLIDFGFAKKFADDRAMLRTRCGTFGYMAPEIEDGAGYSENVDVYACGCVLFMMLSGNLPFDAEDDEEILRLARAGKPNFATEQFSAVGQPVKDLISAMIHVDPKQRMSSEQALEHPWIKSPPETASSTNVLNFVTGLRNYGGVNRFKKAALLVLTHHVGEEDLVRMRGIFEVLDVDGNGMLSMNELKDGCEQCGLMQTEDVRRLFDAVDTDHSGMIDYSEFLAATLDQRTILTRQKCWEAFSVFDLDGDGKISHAELREMLLADQMSSEISVDGDVDQLIAEYDVDNSGEIEFDEFMNMLNRNRT